MSDRPNRRAFAARPADPEQWIKSAYAAPRDGKPSGYTARLTIDITPELRGRIKIAAFQRGVSRVQPVEKKVPIENEFEIDPLDDDQEEAARNSRMNRTMQRVARQVSLDPKDGMEL